jgi:uroporphyrinogen-III synthase
MSEARPLEGVCVLVTRPAAQAGNLCRMIESLGGTALKFPVLEIRTTSDPEALHRVLTELDRFDWAVFVSANAVEKALDALPGDARLPEGLRLAAVGRRTAQALEQRGYRVDACPREKFSSEGLLALPAMQAVAGQRFAIFRGDGGRSELAHVLTERGAVYEYVEAYRRVKPEIDAGPINALGARGGIQCILANSAESLENLWGMLDGGGNAWLAGAQLVVVSQRLLPVAAGLGFVKPPLVAENATDQAVVDTLVKACAE